MFTTKHQQWQNPMGNDREIMVPTGYTPCESIQEMS